jgi:hypothetical protein
MTSHCGYEYIMVWRVNNICTHAIGFLRVNGSYSIHSYLTTYYNNLRFIVELHNLLGSGESMVKIQLIVICLKCLTLFSFIVVWERTYTHPRARIHTRAHVYTHARTYAHTVYYANNEIDSQSPTFMYTSIWFVVILQMFKLKAMSIGSKLLPVFNTYSGIPLSKVNLLT